MCGWESRRHDADLPEEPLGLDRGGELGMHHLEGDVAVVPDVVREIDGCRAAPAEEDGGAVGLPFNSVAVGEGCGESIGYREHARPEDGAEPEGYQPSAIRAPGAPRSSRSRAVPALSTTRPRGTSPFSAAGGR